MPLEAGQDTAAVAVARTQVLAEPLVGVTGNALCSSLLVLVGGSALDVSAPEVVGSLLVAAAVDCTTEEVAIEDAPPEDGTLESAFEDPSIADVLTIEYCTLE